MIYFYFIPVSMTIIIRCKTMFPEMWRSLGPMYFWLEHKMIPF